MTIDSHCHAWAHWPYLSEVPDPLTRGSAEMLLDQMGLSGVDRATIVCAQIYRNFDNNSYVAAAVRRYPDRLEQLADVDSFWSESYHTPGAAKRLEQAAARLPMKGFTHYLAGEDEGAWLDGPEGRDFFRVASDLKLIASISGGPQHQPALRKVAERYPDLTILCHHMAGLRAYTPDARADIEKVLLSAKLPNMHLKLSGFHYVSPPERSWDFPYDAVRWVYEEAYGAFGPRMVWGRDYPVVAKDMTYRQSLEAFKTYCDFVSVPDQSAILGGTLEALLEKARPVEKG